MLEAMACGVPVITSQLTSLGEICTNDSALLVNPARVDDIAKAMHQIAGNEKLRAQLISCGYEQSKKFSWEKAGREMLSMIMDQ